MTLFWVVPPVMGDGHCSINERCDLWALGRSQDRVNQSLSATTTSATAAGICLRDKRCAFGRCAPWLQLPNLRGIYQDGRLHLPAYRRRFDTLLDTGSRKRHRTRQDIFLFFLLAMSCRCFLHVQGQKKKKSPPVKDDRQKRIILLEN